jgi:predicted O-methyltransferase YrrM
MSFSAPESTSFPFSHINTVVQPIEAQEERLRAHWCLPREEARLLYLLAVVGRYRRLLEVGTSIGYSTLHLAQAAHINDGTLHTIDASGERQAEAALNLQKAQLAERVTFHPGDALTVINRLHAEGHTFDLMFIDARKSEYTQYLQWANRLLATGGLLIADNTRSHRHKMQDFIAAVHADPAWEVSDLETPSGLVVARKTAFGRV